MMAKKDRFPPGYCASFVPDYDSEGSGSSGRIDSNSSAPVRKWIDLNSAARDGFAVPIQVIPLCKLSLFERKSLLLQLTSELERIRLLQNKIDLQKTMPVNNVTKTSSSDILSCNNAQKKGLQAGNMKKPSGSGSASGKKSRGWNRGITGRFESAKDQKPLVNLNAGLLKQCESLLKKLMSQEFAWVFNSPVDVVKLNIPDYFDIIKSPMDLGTIKNKLDFGKYSSPLEFLADVRLTFTNAKTYNPPGSDVHVLADTFSRFFEVRWKPIEKKLVVTSQPGHEKLATLDKTGVAKRLTPSKKRKLSPSQHNVMQEPSKRKMTREQKHKISMDLEGFVGDLPYSILDLLRAQTSDRGDGGEEEIEIDIDDLSDDTLFTIRKILDDHIQSLENQENFAKSEACEIELPNVSGLSNSSLQVDKGNDAINEDVDIGGNEAPVTSYPPILIDKDTEARAEEYNQAGPDSGRGSECSKDSSAVTRVKDDIAQAADSAIKGDTDELIGGHSSGGILDHLEHIPPMPYSSDSDGQVDGEGAQTEKQVSPGKLDRASFLKNRFLDTILKAREKTLSQDEKADPERVRRMREELEMHKKREKARLQAEAKAVEDARKQVEAEAAAGERRRRELEREAAREALLKMEKTVEMNETSRFLEDLDMLRGAAAAPLDQLIGGCNCVDERSPEQTQDAFGSFRFGGSNPLEQLGLYMKVDDDEEEVEVEEEYAKPPSIIQRAAVVVNDVEEGEID